MSDIQTLLKSLDYHDADGIRRASLVFSISLFTNISFLAIMDAVLRCQEMFFEFCPREALRFYATENMRKHRPVNAKVFGMLELWLKNPQTKEEVVALELKDGYDVLDAPKYLFKLYGRDKNARGRPDQLANILSFAFPPEFGIDRADEMYDLTRRLAEVFPYQSGCAGFAFQCSRYSPELGEAFAWQKSMRYPEIDIVRSPQDRHAVEQNAVKTVGWLTLVCDAFLTELGGAKAIEKSLGDDIDRIKSGGGLMFRIGSEPTLSDRNRGESVPAYEKLYLALRPLIERAREQSTWFSTGSIDQDEQTEFWFRRFEKK
jgi:hypothetical protein